ncbi:Ser-Thr-rich GPI-anchored membrane family protein [Streptomyces sp. NBC_01304]|uniref:Ser-Thr-rich GPI-anchored membrane family protein n=1 Tax=Streptomyces sp. NBC_01304 TaxID=2903818 RepID=UPI002E0FC788|nr:GPI anchored serine-threonine rich family protein [Streptomyces sp. NBC_01304]
MSTSPMPVRSLGRRVSTALRVPFRALFVDSDDLVVAEPGEGAVWAPGSRQTVVWYFTAGAKETVTVELVQMRGAQAVSRAVLAEDVLATRSGLSVTVPELPAGEYLVQVRAHSILDAFSSPVRIPAA